ncbi:MAG: thermonuclease family protein [Gemmatimonadota bacterium]|nr:thermonuclease family protein [Gemmatimonadota bacterium]
MNKGYIAALVLLAGVTLCFAAERLVVKKVTPDGTLITSWHHRVRLAGIHLPGESAKGGRFEYYGHESVEALKELVEGKEVTIDPIKSGWLFQRGRAYVFVDTVFINAYMLRKGLARCNKKAGHRLAGEFADYELSARKEKRGLWLSPFSAGRD